MSGRVSFKGASSSTLPMSGSLMSRRAALKNFSAKYERQASVDALIAVNDQDARFVHHAYSPRVGWLVADQ